MLNAIVNDVISKLEALKEGEDDVFNKVEFYEGQFEDIQNFIITPPHSFVEFALGNNDNENIINLNGQINIYLCSSHMKGSSYEGMYSLLWKVIIELHGTNIVDGEGKYIEKLFFKSFERIGIFPGFAVFKITLTIGTIPKE